MHDYTEAQYECLTRSLGSPVRSLGELAELRPPLSPEQMRRVAEQARTLLARFYVHLPTKRALYAADPPARLTVLLDRLADLEPGTRDAAREQEFHREMTDIFTSIRDRHTVYLLPDPYRSAIAFLPFVVERCWAGDAEPTYLVTKVHPAVVDEGLPDPRAKGAAPPVRVTHWNGMEIGRAVALNGQVNEGGNRDARLARGLARLTFRWMALGSRPSEDWVTLVYRTEGGEECERTFRWLYVARGPARASVPAAAPSPGTRAIDSEGEWINRVRHTMFASTPEDPVRFERVGREAAYGHLRIHSFDVDSSGLAAYLDQVRAYLREAPPAGLIIDIRSNPGGSIVAAERILEMLSGDPIVPERLEFINTPEAAAMARRYFARFESGAAPSVTQRFERARREASETGAQYIASPPCGEGESEGERARVMRVYHGPTVLVVDALTYSAGDIFAAGFQDHGLGEVIGTDARTGGGGGNVWEYGFVRECAPSFLFDPLPSDASFDVAVRRVTRVGVNGGLAIEDTGVAVDSEPGSDPPAPLLHRLGLRDVMDSNAALVDYAIERLVAAAGGPPRT